MAFEAIEPPRGQPAAELGAYGIRTATLVIGGGPETLPEDAKGREAID